MAFSYTCQKTTQIMNNDADIYLIFIQVKIMLRPN